MDMSTLKESLPEDYDRLKALKAFEETKAGVKGIVDSGIQKVPRIFIRPPDELVQELNYQQSNLQVPVIDLIGIGADDQRKKIISEVKNASKEWGFFQVTNHGIPLNVLDGMLDGIRKFHEQDAEVKKEFNSRDRMQKVKFGSNVDLYRSRAANWRDSLTISLMTSDHIEPDELPEICRDNTVDYTNHVKILGETLLELLAEALGLSPDHLNNMECSKGHQVSCHYYPACPEPELTLGATKHSDPGFLTVLLQNQISGLQILYQDQWVNIEPTPGGLVVNIGDLLQLVSNGRFISSKHRVIANSIGPRISVAYFFSGPIGEAKTYGPIKELISEENPTKYRDLLLSEYMGRFMKTGLDDENWGINYYKL
ncbi:UNVERIFIED_CONTAM: 1-aminocyclopropane-1-carboxylate oxidase1 [Sesamum radiatum]|uniref:1-aminocyclopropane-1-carboxylate oxidase1 n=1 Tax=Sesamum radiatum TaxID=300843 RepID=A0AAW2S7H4_SESRA